MQHAANHNLAWCMVHGNSFKYSRTESLPKQKFAKININNYFAVRAARDKRFEQRNRAIKMPWYIYIKLSFFITVHQKKACRNTVTPFAVAREYELAKESA